LANGSGWREGEEEKGKRTVERRKKSLLSLCLSQKDAIVIEGWERGGNRWLLLGALKKKFL